MNKPRSNGLTGKPSNNLGKGKVGKYRTRSIAFPPRLLDALEAKAKAEDTTVNNLVLRAVTESCVSV